MKNENFDEIDNAVRYDNKKGYNNDLTRIEKLRKSYLKFNK